MQCSTIVALHPFPSPLPLCFAASSAQGGFETAFITKCSLVPSPFSTTLSQSVPKVRNSGDSVKPQRKCQLGSGLAKLTRDRQGFKLTHSENHSGCLLHAGCRLLDRTSLLFSKSDLSRLFRRFSLAAS